MKILLAILAATALATAPPDPAAGPAGNDERAVVPDPLAGLAWLGGCWENRSGDRVSFEMWTPPAGGVMVGAGRTVSGGRTVGFEHLRIRAEGEGLVYTAIPSGQAETEFRSAAIDEDGFTVENPEHDFPTRIRYRRSGPDAFTATVEGPGPDGTTSGFEVAFERARCEAAGE